MNWHQISAIFIGNAIGSCLVVGVIWFATRLTKPRPDLATKEDVEKCLERLRLLKDDMERK